MPKPSLYVAIRMGLIKVGKRSSLEQRFWKSVDKDGPTHPILGTKCWTWTGSKCIGYGVISYKNKSTKAHRLSYTLQCGEVPSDVLVCHHCDNRGCVNPDHLFLGTCQDNITDMMNKGRHARKGPNNPVKGETCHLSKLTDEIDQQIRKLYVPDHPVYGYRPLGKKFGVTSGSIKNIIRNKTWRHVV